jgi:hypothetical protein
MFSNVRKRYMFKYKTPSLATMKAIAETTGEYPLSEQHFRPGVLSLHLRHYSAAGPIINGIDHNLLGASTGVN